MARKVIIDCDPGIDDAVALSLALFDPKVEVVAVTAVEGSVLAPRATCNVQTIIDRLDPPRLPRIGAASSPDHPKIVQEVNWINGPDGLGNVGFEVSELHHQHPSEKIIADAIRSDPGEVSIICLGPLTNVARAFQRDPVMAEMVDRLIISGGAVNGIGNVTPIAEFNMYYDAEAARSVFQSPTTKTLVPLDVTSRVNLTLDVLDELPPEETRAGEFLRKILPYAYRAYRQQFAQESINLPDVVAMVAALHPELFETVDMEGDVETAGEITLGATVFDRRKNIQNRGDMEVAMSLDETAVKDCIIRGLKNAGGFG